MTFQVFMTHNNLERTINLLSYNLSWGFDNRYLKNLCIEDYDMVVSIWGQTNLELCTRSNQRAYRSCAEILIT